MGDETEGMEETAEGVGRKGEGVALGTIYKQRKSPRMPSDDSRSGRKSTG